MKKRIFALVLTMVMALSLTACGGGSGSTGSASGGASSGGSASGGASGEPMNIKISTALTENSVTGQALNKFKEEVAAKSDGRISVDVYYNSVLGAYTSVLDMMAEGDVQMQTLNPVAFDTEIPTLATLNEHYMFDDLDHVHRFFEGDGGKVIMDSWRKSDLHGMAMFGLGFRELSNNTREVKTIKDMQGLTIRGYSTVQIAAWQAIGAVPTSVDWNELFVSMQQGLLDGQEGALSTINDFSFYEVQKYITMTNHVFTCDMLVADVTWYDGLSEEDRKIIDEAMNVAYEWQKEAYQADLAKLMDKFTNEYGITITEVDESTKAELTEKMSGATSKLIVELTGQELYDEIHGYVEATRS